MMAELTKLDRELLVELKKIRDERQFVNGVFLYAEEQSERRQILAYIKKNENSITSSDVVLMALELELDRKKINKGGVS